MGSRVTIEPVTTAGELEAFLAVPERLHAADPAWVPPLRMWVKRRLSPKNPFLREAKLTLYVARRDGELVGRISSLRDPRWEQYKQEKTGFFGFFETAEDEGVARDLLDRAADDARAWGAETLRGPRNLTRVEEVGVCVDGYDQPPPLLANHHPPYYRALLESLGLVKHHDVLAYDTALYDEHGAPRALPDKLRAKADAVDLPGLEIRQVRWRTLSRDLTDAHEVFTEAFRSVPDTTPMPRDQFVNLCRAILMLSDLRMMQIASVGGRPIAFAVCVPELNEAITHARGRLAPTGWARFGLGLRKIRTASFKLIGVLPEYRTSGVHALLIRHVVDALRAVGYDRLEASLIDERNQPMRAVVEGAGCTVYKRWRWFDRAL